MESDIQRIVDRILQDADKKAESILKEAQKSAEALLENQRQLARQKAAEDERSLSKRAESEVGVIKGRVIADAQRRADWMILSEKERLISNVLSEVKKRLNELSKSEKYVHVLEKMVIDAGIVLGGGELQVALNRDDSSLPLKMNVLGKTITDKTGVKTQLKLSKEKIEAVGAIIKTADGRVVVDNTFEAILQRREKEIRFKIAKILFRD